MPRFAVLAIALSFANSARADETLIDYGRGSIPILITAPHGGLDDIPGVPERTNSQAERFVTGVDVNSRELALRFIRELERRTGGKPYYVLARFRRRYVDANRSAEHAYESQNARPVYDAYHARIAEYCSEIQNKFGVGLLVDVHGQAVNVNDLMVGTVGGKTVTLARQRRGDAAIFGVDGLVGQLNKAGVRTLPRVNAPDPNLPVFNGGYTVQTYGSHQPAGIDAVQFEFGTNYRRPERLDDSAKRAATAVAAFYQTHIRKKASLGSE